ncbi:MAG: hypothetical protein ACFE75_08870 [Candidatus Hodarchaeota archaeon]
MQKYEIKISLRKRIRYSLIVITIIFAFLSSGIIPPMDWGDIKEKPQPIWYDPNLADYIDFEF